MLRLLLTPRWLGATALVIVAVLTCLGLGVWQYDRAHRPPRPVPLADERVVPLDDVAAQPADLDFPSGLLVRGAGHYDGSDVVVRGTNAAGATSAWATSALVAIGAPHPVVVVRGAAVPAPSAVPTGDVVLTGRLQPPAASGGLSAAALTERGGDPRGYLVLTAQQPTDAHPPTLVSSPVPLRSPGLRWQNSVYAVQWWLFAAFFVFGWVRFFREDLRAQREDAAAASA